MTLTRIRKVIIFFLPILFLKVKGQRLPIDIRCWEGAQENPRNSDFQDDLIQFGIEDSCATEDVLVLLVQLRALGIRQGVSGANRDTWRRLCEWRNLGTCKCWNRDHVVWIGRWVLAAITTLELWIQLWLFHHSLRTTFGRLSVRISHGMIPKLIRKKRTNVFVPLTAVNFSQAFWRHY